MTKRMLLLAGVVLIVLSAAPDAMATCERCRYYPVWREWACITPPPLLSGHQFCDEGGTWCEEWGEYCPPTGGGAASLASEYTVASVERLDGSERGASETLVAQAEIAPTLNH